MMMMNKDPKMMAQMFLEKVGAMDLAELEPAKADELKKIVSEVKANMDKPEMIMPLIAKAKTLMMPSVEVSIEVQKEEEMPEKEDASKEMPKKDYSAMDAINEIKALLAKVKEED